jgi:hypothetical protein
MHRHYREFRRIEFVDAEGREYVPAREVPPDADARDWHFDVRIPLRARTAYAKRTGDSLEFPAHGSVIQFIVKIKKERVVIADATVVLHTSDIGIKSTARVCVQKRAVYNYERLGQIFAMSPETSPRPGLGRARASLH